MLVYHPAFDLYNCIFRMLCLLDASTETEIHFDKLRIWDFYLTFPAEVASIQFPQHLRSQKATYARFGENTYEKLVNKTRIFDRMQSYQHSAIRCLASYGFVEAELLTKKIIRRTEEQYPQEIRDEIAKLSDLKRNVVKLLVNDFVNLPLYGAAGLKYRSGLIPFKYDPKP